MARRLLPLFLLTLIGTPIIDADGEWTIALAVGQDEIAAIAQVLPPPSEFSVPDQKRREIIKNLAVLDDRLSRMTDESLKPDIEIYAKAVSKAIFQNEIYNEEELKWVFDAFTAANARLDELELGKHEWTEQVKVIGRDPTENELLQVRGYRSSIDGSVQPYGLEFPARTIRNRLPPLYVWLHDRNEKSGDLQFISERHTQAGPIQPPLAMVLHPFGRQCMGYKFAGEIDVLEAIEHVKENYEIDDQQIILMGFSMGGAGVWHLAAHYPHQWSGASAGAGFVETAEYNDLRKEDYPPKYVQTLWRMYDVPFYTRNLYNLDFVAYSGENDPEIKALRRMAEAHKNAKKEYDMNAGDFEVEIAEDTGHEYQAESLAKILSLMRTAGKNGRSDDPNQIWLQTQTLRYNRVPGVEVMGLKKHWQDSRIDAFKRGETLFVRTQNITAVRFPVWQTRPAATISIDMQAIAVRDAKDPANSYLVRSGDKWSWNAAEDETLQKRPGLQGPIDDAFMEPFVTVVPTGSSKNPLVQRWVDFESMQFENRWRSLFRGDVTIVKDVQVSDTVAGSHNLLLWGDPDSNSYLRSILPNLPLEWNEKELKVKGKTYDAKKHVPVMIFPNPKHPHQYIVINSGPTVREAHVTSSSLLNPQLPDWAVIDLTQSPNAESPGRVVAADFFNESWQFEQ